MKMVPLTRLALALFATAPFLSSCSLPPREAWAQIQTHGLFPYMRGDIHSSPTLPDAPTAPATAPSTSPSQMLASQPPTTTPSPAPTVAQQTPSSSQRDPLPTLDTPTLDRSPPPSRPTPSTPTAEPVVSLPGYVRSPHSPQPRLVDVRGMTPGSKVVCPYTQKPFFVPSAPAAPPTVASTTPAPSTPKVTEPKPQPKPEASPQPEPTPQLAALPELPYGTAIAGRPGFVNSPYAAKHQLVDVTGLRTGMEVKCPYSGKLFRVPPEAQAKADTETP